MKIIKSLSSFAKHITNACLFRMPQADSGGLEYGVMTRRAVTRQRSRSVTKTIAIEISKTCKLFYIVM